MPSSTASSPASPSLAVGSPAPAFQLKALGSSRTIARPGSDPAGAPPSAPTSVPHSAPASEPSAPLGPALLLVFHDQNTVAEVQSMQETIRTHYGDAQQLLIASVVNMKSVPVFLRSAAEGVMKGAYAQAAAAMPAGLDPADYVIILLDWDGKVSAAYGAHKIDKQPKLVLIDSTGTVRGLHRGSHLTEPGLALVHALFAPPTAPDHPPV